MYAVARQFRKAVLKRALIYIISAFNILAFFMPLQERKIVDSHPDCRALDRKKMMKGTIYKVVNVKISTPGRDRW